MDEVEERLREIEHDSDIYAEESTRRWLISQVRHLRQLVYAQELPEGWHEADDASVQLAVDNAELRQQAERLRDCISRNIDRLVEAGFGCKPNDGEHLLTGAVTLVLAQVERLTNFLKLIEWGHDKTCLYCHYHKSTETHNYNCPWFHFWQRQSSGDETSGDSGEVQTNRNGEE